MSKKREFKSNGIQYIFQRPPLSYVGKLTDDSKEGRVIIPVKYYKNIMEHVIVSPKVDFAHFDKIEPNKEKKIELNGVEYTFVYPGAKKVAEIERAMQDDDGSPSEYNIHVQLLEHVIRVDGEKVDFDFFEELDDPTDFFTVIDEATEFFRNNEFKKVIDEAVAFFRGKKK